MHLVEVEETLGVNNIVVSWNLDHLQLVFKVKGDSLIVGGQALLDGEIGASGFSGGHNKEEKREKEEEQRLHC